ncbi:MAG: MBL fold metallo-hydrolase [Alphaproteobacteria bacterium]|nr:MBL fold metallo-hydrolase [Alphaproteobacteria bacterium]
MNKKYYLKSNVKAEPLIWKWYAWSYLIPPITAGCNIRDRHIKIMQSYVSSPKIHAQAVKNPKLLGGPFIDLSGERVDEIKDLINETQENCHNLLNLANSVKEFDILLQTRAIGDSLESLYKEIPEDLKGCLELVYDINSHPSFRIIEPLIYHKFFDPSYQELAFSVVESDFRPFILSTPRLENNKEVYIQIPFENKIWDDLFLMRYSPGSISDFFDRMSIPDAKLNLFRDLFTESPPSLGQDRHYDGEGIRVRYFGHACILLQTRDVSILIDPVLSYKLDSGLERYTFYDLPDEIDYVLLTHNHQDHILFETLLQIRHKVKNIVFPNSNKGSIVDPSLKYILEKIGYTSLHELNEFDSIDVPDGCITGIPFLGEHADLNIHSKIAHCVEIKGKKLVFAADSRNLDPALYDLIRDYIGPIDVLYLGMECDGAPLSWLYGPLLTKPLKRSFDESRNLSGSDSDKAWKLVKSMDCKEVYIYAMGQEPWLGYIMALEYTEESPQLIESNKFISLCKNNGINIERLYGKKEIYYEHRSQQSLASSI